MRSSATGTHREQAQLPPVDNSLASQKAQIQAKGLISSGPEIKSLSSITHVPPVKISRRNNLKSQAGISKQ